MTKKPADGVTTEPKLYGGKPNEAGWFAIFTEEDGQVEVAGAAHIREGVTLKEAAAAWKKNTEESFGEVFDVVLDREALAREGLPDLKESKNGAPVPTSTPEPPKDPKNPLPDSDGNSRTESTIDPTRTAKGRATGSKSDKRNRKFEVPPRTPADHAEKGSRKGEKDGRFDNDWWTAIAGYAKAFYEGISELGVMAWDAGGALVDKLSDDYEHDYLSNVGRAVGEQGQNLSDVLLEGMVDRIKAAGRMAEDLERGDYYAAGAEAQSMPGPLSSPGGALKVVGKAGKVTTGLAKKAVKKVKVKKKTAPKQTKIDVRRDPHRLPKDPDDQTDFDKASFHDMRLDDDLIGPDISDSKQFRAATKDLKKYLTDPRNAHQWKNFTPKEQQALIDAFGRFDKEGVSSARIKGFRWHHDGRDPTVLRLIKAEVHDFAENLHHGGRFVTGGR